MNEQENNQDSPPRINKKIKKRRESKNHIDEGQYSTFNKNHIDEGQYSTINTEKIPSTNDSSNNHVRHEYFVPHAGHIALVILYALYAGVKYFFTGFFLGTKNLILFSLIFVKFTLWLSLFGALLLSGPEGLRELFYLWGVCWIVGIIYPPAVFRFGLPNERPKVSKLYSTLMALTLGFDYFFQDVINNLGLNAFQGWVIGFAGTLIILKLIYPSGTILKNKNTEDTEDTEEPNGLKYRFKSVFGYFVWTIIITLVIQALRSGGSPSELEMIGFFYHINL